MKKELDKVRLENKSKIKILEELQSQLQTEKLKIDKKAQKFFRNFNKRSQAKSQLGRSNLCKKDESLNSNNNSLAKVILEGKPKNKHQDEDN